MKLKQRFIEISLPGVAEGKGPRRVSVLCMAWEEIGLAIHKGYKTTEKTWTITHINSGRSVLKDIAKQSEAMKYMELLVGVMEDWKFTEEEFSKWKAENPESSKNVKADIDTLQREIYNHRR